MGIDEVLDLGVRVGMGNTSFRSRRKCKMFSFTPFPRGGGHRWQQKAEGLFCVFLRPDEQKESPGALGFPSRAGGEGVHSELHCYCQGAGEALLRVNG